MTDFLDDLSLSPKSKTLFKGYIRKYLDTPPNELIDKIFSDYSNSNTRKNIVSAMVHLYRHKGNKNMVEKLEIARNSTQKNVDKFYEDRKIDTLSQQDFKRMQDYAQAILKKAPSNDEAIILLLYSGMIPVVRNDYAGMKIAGTKTNTGEGNWIMMKSGKPTHFIFNDYKTNKSHGTVEIEIPQDLGKWMGRYIRSDKKKAGDVLLNVSESRVPHILRKFGEKLFGKPIGINYLRKSYATVKWGDEIKQINELEKEIERESEGMMNSVGKIKKVYNQNK